MSSYRPFEVTGIELEYPIVDAELRPRCLVEQAFRRIAGRPTSDVAFRNAGFSNELAAHVFEIKTLRPQRHLKAAEKALFEGMTYFTRILREFFAARLLPTGMHPYMDLSETSLWPRAGREIYRSYARVFSIREHGWLNVQSCHVNLPFGTEAETVLLHNAVACLLPYLPALAASSPIYDGRLGPLVDNRLGFYATNQRRIPEVSGRVIPEFITSYADYRRRVLRPIYQALGRVAGAQRLRHEWVNSRGAILRFNRSAIEIRILDTQECVKMDIAIAAFIRGALKWMVKELARGRSKLPEHGMLVEDFRRVVARGGRARVLASHLLDGKTSGTAVPISEVLQYLWRQACSHASDDESPYLPLVRERIQRGSLSECIRRAVGRSRAPATRAASIRRIYGELAECLEDNRPWEG